MTEITLEQILGFSKQESKLNRVLGEKAMLVAEISRKASLPRMTTHNILQRLRDRGLVKRIKRDKQFFYQRISSEDIFRKLLPQTGLSSGTISIPIEKGAGVTIHRGLQEIFVLHKKIAEQNAGGRVYTIQTSASTRQIVTNYSKREIDLLHSFITTRKIVSEDIVEEDFFDVAKQEYGKGFEKALKKFLNRLSVVYVLPSDLITFENDMIITKDTAIFIDWRKKIAIEIYNKETVRLCLGLFEVYKSGARRVEYRDLAKKYLSKK